MNTNEMINENVDENNDDKQLFTEDEYAIICNLIERARVGKSVWQNEELEPILTKMRIYWAQNLFLKPERRAEFDPVQANETTEPLFTEDEHCIVTNLVEDELYGKNNLWGENEVEPIRAKLRAWWVETYWPQHKAKKEKLKLEKRMRRQEKKAQKLAG